MRVKVIDIAGPFVSTVAAGQQLLALIEPPLERGEPVVLDFEGMRHVGVPFFNYSVGILIEKDTAGDLPGLLSYENLPPMGRLALESVTAYATHRRENPRWAAAADALVGKLYERD